MTMGRRSSAAGLYDPALFQWLVDQGVRCEPAGRRILKGFEEPVRVFTASHAAG